MTDTTARATRSDSYDPAILGADGRAWHPLRRKDLDFETPFDIDATCLLPETMIVGLQTPHAAGRLKDPALRTRFVNETAQIYLSDILNGERAALTYAATLCLYASDLGAQEYAANQAREEARHVAAFSMYIAKRWGRPVAPTPVFAQFLDEIRATPSAACKAAGMQVLVEGLAMGIFTALGSEWRDPLGAKMIRLVMADEAAHLKTGKISLEDSLADLGDAERADVERWTARQFLRLSRGLFAPGQRPELYARFGLDHRQVTREIGLYRAPELGGGPQAAGIFRTAAKAVLRAGLVTPPTARAYASFLSADELDGLRAV